METEHVMHLLEAGADALASRAVTLSWLRDFVAENRCEQMPTWQVVRDIIQPRTAADKS